MIPQIRSKVSPYAIVIFIILWSINVILKLRKIAHKTCLKYHSFNMLRSVINFKLFSIWYSYNNNIRIYRFYLFIDLNRILMSCVIRQSTYFIKSQTSSFVLDKLSPRYGRSTEAVKQYFTTAIKAAVAIVKSHWL